MRTPLLLLASLLFFNQAMAQDSARRPLIYASFTGQFGSLAGGRASAAAIMGKRHEFSVGYEMYLQDARNQPRDFFCWSCKHGPDKDWIHGATLSYGYVLYPNFLKGFSRVILRTGVLLGTQSIPYQFTEVASPKPFGNNYTYDYDRHFAAAWIINPSLDIALGRAVGLTIGPYGILNQDFAGGGISFGVLVGSVAKEKPAVRGRPGATSKVAPVNSQ